MSLDVLSLVFAPLGLGAFPSPADAVPSPGLFLEGRHVDRRGLRDYRLYVPLSHAACAAGSPRADAPDEAGARAAGASLSPLPLVVMLHGCTQTPEDFARGTRMNEAAEALGFLVLYPGQCPRANPSRCWNWFSPAERRRDAGEAGLLAGLVRDVMARYPVDPARVYVAGLSAGGAMAAAMGAVYPDLFAAVGVHSGPVPGAASDLSSALATMRDGPGGDLVAPEAMPPLIVFHGDRDDTVHPSHGAHLAGARHDDCGCGCGGGCGGRREAVADAAAPRAGRAAIAGSARSYTRRALRDEQGRVRAEHWSVHGSGHAWSGGSAEGSYTDPAGPSATDAMLRFFFAHALHQPATAPARRLRLPWLRGPRRRGALPQKPGTRSPSIFARAKT